eukprot:CAMPEP_0170502964 /NCGR_PEP_ID=MMETSP0208-20121228/43195_1 /TAXON_ID=197538 /ORGANISM="Strombidium inclinatum, Strain S3" /LENGTH=37 /DNA_ID= /DNA_START= /DNA_END= /DNA_ORIENTATION=
MAIETSPADDLKVFKDVSEFVDAMYRPLLSLKQHKSF